MEPAPLYCLLKPPLIKREYCFLSELQNKIIFIILDLQNVAGIKLKNTCIYIVSNCKYCKYFILFALSFNI